MTAVRKTKRATWVPHAKGWTVRPTVNGRRYFLGYWPDEKQAVDAANTFKAGADSRSSEDIEAAAEQLRLLANQKTADHRHDELQRKQRKLTLSDRVTALELRLQNLEEQRAD